MREEDKPVTVSFFLKFTSKLISAFLWQAKGKRILLAIEGCGFGDPVVRHRFSLEIKV